MKYFLLALLSLPLASCSSEISEPKKGPKSSWWLGGDDGGAFVDIKDDDNTNDRIYSGTIYFDSDKTVWYSGPFKLVGKLKFTPSNHEHYIYWDGENLHLKEQSYLKAVNPIPKL